MIQTTIYDFLPTEDFVKRVYDFNLQANLISKGYDDLRESAFQVEEALEGFNIDLLARLISPSNPASNPKYLSRQIIGIANTRPFTGDDIDRVDKHVDGIIYHIGSLAKLGLTVDQIHAAIHLVADANLQKLAKPTYDAEGKLLKPADFTPPESNLQELLSES